MNYPYKKSLGIHPAMTVIAAAVAAMLSGPAAAVKIDTGNPDAELRWDNTVKYNAGWRMRERDNALGDNYGWQAGTYKFDKHDMVTNRVDLLTEFDYVYKSNYGFRISGAAWSDAAYNGEVRGNPKFASLPVGNTVYPNNKFTNFAKRYNTSSGELLDAFVFGRVDFGDMPLDLKAGRHAVYWGESLFTPIHGVSVAQSPADFRKALATPGIEVKELFLPTNQISGHFQLNESVSFAAQYLLEWKPFRLPDGGTYLSQGDIIGNGGTNYFGIPVSGDLSSGRDAVPKNRGNWGVMMKAAPTWLDGTVGLYYRKFDDKVPAVLFNSTFTELHNAYAKDVKLIGVSLSKSVGGVSVGAEVVHRKNTALATYFGAADIARGDSWHALVNALAYIGKTPAFDSAVVLAELTYSKLDKIYSGSAAYYNGLAYAHCQTGEPGYGSYTRKDGCSTNDAWGLSLAFTPTWFQAMPSVDLTLPISYSVGLKGNSPVPAGGNQGSGSWSIGLGADYQARYKFNLAYNAYLGDYGTTTGMLGTPVINGSTNAGNGTLKDRGWLSFTFKTSF